MIPAEAILFETAPPGLRGFEYRSYQSTNLQPAVTRASSSSATYLQKSSALSAFLSILSKRSCPVIYARRLSTLQASCLKRNPYLKRDLLHIRLSSSGNRFRRNSLRVSFRQAWYIVCCKSLTSTCRSK